MNLFTKEQTQTIRAGLQRGEKDLPESILELIYEKKLFRLFLPGELGGLELSLPEALKVIDHCSYIGGDFGWQVNIGSGGGFFAGFIDPEVARERFNKRNFVIAGSGIPAGTLRKEGDGYVVNGSWKYCSGCTYATLFTFNCMIPGGGMKAVALEPGQVRITEDWTGYGLTATTSHTVSAEDAVVPETMTFDVTRKTEDYGYRLFDYPFMEFARAAFFASVSGCFRHFLEETEAYSAGLGAGQQEKRRFLERLTGGHRETFVRKMDEYEKTLNRSWAELEQNGSIEKEILEELNSQIFGLTNFIHASAAEILFYTGMPAVRTTSPINKTWRDLSTACQHVFLKQYG